MAVLKSAGKLFQARAANNIITFVGITVFARILGPSELGKFFLFQAFIGATSVAIDFGLRGAVEKRVSEGSEPSKFLASGAVLKAFLITIGILLIYMFSESIESYIGLSVIHLVVIALVFREFGQLSLQTLNAELRVAETAPIILAQKLVWTISSFLLIQLDFGVIGVIYGYIMGIFTLLLLSEYKRSIHVSRPSRDHTISLIQYAKFDIISASGAKMFSWLDVLLIGYFLSSHFVGAYEMAWKVAIMTLAFSKSIYTAMFPHISLMSEKEKDEEIAKLLSNMVTPSLYFVIPSLFGTLLLSSEILGLLFGSEFTIASLVLPILMLKKIVTAYDTIIGRALQALDYPDLAAYSTFIGLASNIILNIALIWQFGIVGGAVATLTSYILMSFIRLRYLREIVGSFEILPRELWYCFGASILMSAFILAIKIINNISNVIELLCVVSLGAVIYVGATSLSQGVRNQVLSPFIE